MVKLLSEFGFSNILLVRVIGDTLVHTCVFGGDLCSRAGRVSLRNRDTCL